MKKVLSMTMVALMATTMMASACSTCGCKCAPKAPVKPAVAVKPVAAKPVVKPVAVVTPAPAVAPAPVATPAPEAPKAKKCCFKKLFHIGE